MAAQNCVGLKRQQIHFQWFRSLPVVSAVPRIRSTALDQAKRWWQTPVGSSGWPGTHFFFQGRTQKVRAGRESQKMAVKRDQIPYSLRHGLIQRE